MRKILLLVNGRVRIETHYLRYCIGSTFTIAHLSVTSSFQGITDATGQNRDEERNFCWTPWALPPSPACWGNQSNIEIAAQLRWWQMQVRSQWTPRKAGEITVGAGKGRSGLPCGFEPFPQPGWLLTRAGDHRAPSVQIPVSSKNVSTSVSQTVPRVCSNDV